MFRRLEEDRLEQLRSLALHYQAAMADHRPRLVSSAQRLLEPVRSCRVDMDMEAVDKKVNTFCSFIWDSPYCVVSPGFP